MFFFTLAKINIDHTLVGTAGWLSAPYPLRNSGGGGVCFFLESADGGCPTWTWDGGRHFTCVSKKEGIKGILSLGGREKHLMFCNRKPHSGTSCRDASSHPFVF